MTVSSSIYNLIIQRALVARASGSVVAVVTGKAAAASEVADRLRADGVLVATFGPITPLEYQRTLDSVSAHRVNAVIVSEAMWSTWAAPSSVSAVVRIDHLAPVSEVRQLARV